MIVDPVLFPMEEFDFMNYEEQLARKDEDLEEEEEYD